MGLHRDEPSERGQEAATCSANRAGPDGVCYFGNLRRTRPAVCDDCPSAVWYGYSAWGATSPVVVGYPAASGAGIWTDNAYRLWAKKVFSPAANRAGLKGLRPYDLRHTFASQR